MGEAIGNKVLTNRTPDLIAAEINSIKEQTQKLVLYNSIEIGRRLVEAKTMLQHGAWGTWLESSVDYSQRTANNLMRIFEEYGTNQIAFFDNNANSQALANLSYTQAVALLGIPDAEEREYFVKEHDVENMSTRELQQAIKDKQELEQKLKEAEKEAETNKNLYDTVSKSYDRLEETNSKHFERAETLQKELDSIKKQLLEAQKSGNDEKIEILKKSLREAEKDLTDQANRIEELEQQVKEKPIEAEVAPVVEKVPEEVEKELEELRKKVVQQNNSVTFKFSAYFDVLVKGFKDLLGILAEMKDIDGAEYERYKKAVAGLIGKMSERL